MLTSPNPFAALLDPARVLGDCARSGALAALPVSARCSADRTHPGLAAETAAHDAAIDELHRQRSAKA